MSKKKALITGITGQDGSYLAEFLLEKDYDVYGLIRRTSTINYERIAHIQDQVTLIPGDMSDQTSLMNALTQVQPDEVYNLAAQSFVGTSWQQPVFTGDVTGLGVTRMLDAIRAVKPDLRFYQASSSEMFGKVREVPQKETTPFYPRSPYGVAKVYGHWITVNYRESYNMHASSGILFNHESVTGETPVFVRRNWVIDLLPIEDVVPHGSDPDVTPRYSTVPDDDIEVWDVNGWVQVTCMTAHIDTPRKTVHRVAAGGAVYHATEDHVVFVCEDGQPVEKPAAEVQVGDQLPLIGMPEPPNIIILSEDEAWLLGVITAIGGIDTGQSAICITTEDQDLLDEVTTCWQRLVKENRISRHTYIDTETQHTVTELYLRNGGSSYVADLCDTLHTKAGDKRVPLRILNASLTSRAAFMDGFEAATGLNPVVETTSATLAAGLYWMAMTSMSQQPSVRTVERDGDLVYQVNLYAGDALLGADQFRELDEVVEARPVEYDGWLYDLATTSETFHAGVGRGWIHNSPRRGLEFVTRKVTYHAAMIKLGLANELRIGNTDSRRDWGFAGDYVQAMWLMLQQDEPDDYVVATGETNTVERLLEVAFDTVDLNWRDHTVQDERFMRPAEVDLLVGDPSKAKAKLTWEPAVSFEELVQMMVESDIQFLKTHHRI